MNNDLSHLEELLSNRKIVRSYKKVNFDTEPLKNIASYSIKIPTAGFSRGIEIIQVFNTETIDKISNLFHERKYIEEGKDPWISNSVALFFILLNEDAYHQRYSKSDKAKAGLMQIHSKSLQSKMESKPSKQDKAKKLCIVARNLPVQT